MSSESFKWKHAITIGYEDVVQFPLSSCILQMSNFYVPDGGNIGVFVCLEKPRFVQIYSIQNQ